MANEIKIEDAVYTDDLITSADAFIVRSIDGDELQYDTFSSTLELGRTEPTKFIPKGSSGMLTADAKLFMCLPYVFFLVSDPTKYKYGTETLVTCNGRVIGKFYLSEVHKLSKSKFEIKCVSAVGILDNSLHYGGIYPTGATVRELLDSIIGDVVKYSIDDTQKIDGKVINISNTKLYGWLPVASRRENLHQVLFAVGATVTSDPVTGDLKIVPLTATATKDIPSDRVFKEGSIEYPREVRLISLTEHSYNKGKKTEEKEIFKGEVVNDPIVSPATGQLLSGSIVLFENPMYDLRIETGEILEQGVNYAILAPTTKCALYGKEYLHGTRQLTYSTANTIGIIGDYDEKEKKLTVSEAWLVSLANSERVAERLLSYYHSAKTVSTDIKVADENPGDTVSFIDPFNAPTEGIIESMDIHLSNMNRAKTKIISDYTPPIPGNTFTRKAEILEDTTWTVPEGVKKVKLVLIGGGCGGYSGNRGHHGKSNSQFPSEYDEDGLGGVGGLGGLGGRVFIASATVKPGFQFNIKIGNGGTGGSPSVEASNIGTEGTATTAGVYSSANGELSESGFVDIFSGNVYAGRGESGINGGRGNTKGEPRETVTYKGVTYNPGKDGSSASGGFGGLGGGAAAGSNGFNGNNAGSYDGGRGGNGGNAIQPDPVTLRGIGGTGGHGGGGGGEGGPGKSSSNDGGEGGQGGSGSTGGTGARGIAIIYY